MQHTASQASAVDRRLAKDPVAIVGLAGRFPRAGDVRAFWDNIMSARDCSDLVPSSWWRTDQYYDPDPFAPDKTYCRRGGFLTPEVFDPLEFGIPPNTLDSTGLVQLLSLVVAKEALEDAGQGRADWYEAARTGVVLGVCGTNSTIMPLAARLFVPQMAETMRSQGVPEDQVDAVVRSQLAALPKWTEDSFPGVLGNVVSGRIANRLNLGAANHTVDAACASSLAALRSAVDELLSRRADLMLTGGCDTDNAIVSFMCFSKTPALSPSEQVRPFDAEADGTLVGEGVGVLVLKRLADAERDGDRVYAVLRGLGSSSDGRTGSIYAPCGEGQVAALRRAYEDADCPPRTVQLIEAHGTGTRVGDGVELAALNEVLSGPEERHFAAVGSVKSQIGHTKAAAGAAGVIKAALALHHRVLPPTINVREPHAQTAREGSALYLNTHARPWVLDPSRPVRRAGVSSFGFGGVNYHAVLEEYTGGGEERDHPLHDVPRMALWHAPDAEELLRRLEAGEGPAREPAPPGHTRIGFVATGEEEYGELLALAAKRLRQDPDLPQWRHPRGIHYRASALPPEAGVAALFAGQGSQYVGMGLRTALAVPPVRAAFDDANALFPPSDSLAGAVFPPPVAEDAETRNERLRRTGHAQSAIGALSVGQYRYLRMMGFAPRSALGHSFGELTALWAAGVLDDGAFTRLARARGQAMELPAGTDADPGRMIAVMASPGELGALLAEVPGMTVSGRNAPDQYTVAGPTPSALRFAELCADRGVRAKPLDVAAAFHTPLVEHAAEAFAAACAGTAFAAPALRVHSTTAGAAYVGEADADRRTLVRQLVEPVDFAARLEEMYADGTRVFVEFGPGRVLTQLVERTLGDRGVEAIACDHGPGADGAVALKEAALRLAVLGRVASVTDPCARTAGRKRTQPSKVARALEGPMFAMEALRPSVPPRPARAAASAVSPAEPEGGAVPEEPVVAPAAQNDPLARAAAEHLAAHTRYLDGQLRTAGQLTDLLRRGSRGEGIDPALATAVHTVAEHSMALGRTHERAGEVVARLLGLPSAAPERPGGETPAFTPPPFDDTPTRPADDGATALSLPKQSDPFGARPAAGDEPPVPSARSAFAELWAAEQGAAGVGEPTADPGEVDLAELEHVCRAVVAEKTGYDIDMIESGMHIQEELGIDSLKQIEIGAEIWRRYPAIGRDELYRFTEAETVGELTDMVRTVLTRTESRSELVITPMSADVGPTFVSLRRLPPVDVCVGLYPGRPCALLLDDGGELVTVLSGSLSALGWRTRLLALPGVTPAGGPGSAGAAALPDWDEGSLSSCLAELLADDPRVDLCVLPFSRGADDDAHRTIRRLCHAVLTTKHVLPHLQAAAEGGTRAALVSVTQLDGALGHAGTDGDVVQALAGGVGGLVKVAALEASTLFCRAVDLAPGLTTEQIGTAFAAEIADLATDVREVGVGADGSRRTPVLSRTPDPLLPPTGKDIELTEDDFLLVTGGAGGITSWCVRSLAARHACGYLLLGRTPLEEEPAWAAGLRTEEELRGALEERARAAGEDPLAPGTAAEIARHGRLLLARREIRSTLDALRVRGVEAHYVSADVRDAAQVASALAPYAARITGVVHGAGVLGDRPLRDAAADSVASVVETKVSGLHHVLDALDHDRLRHLVLFSSVVGVWGNLRQSDYALANGTLNTFACAFQAAHPGCRVVPIAWGPWDGGMADRIHEVFADAGVPVLTREQGTTHFMDRMAVGTEWSGTTVVGPATPFYRRIERLPSAGRTAHRAVTGLGEEPVLRDHCFAHVPVLPMTAAVGWGVHSVERALGGVRPVLTCEGFTIAQGVFLPPGHQERFRVDLVPREDPASVTVSVRDPEPDGTLRYEGVFRHAVEPGEAPRVALPPYRIDDAPHPAYGDGRLFHGPTLRGLRNVLTQEPRRVVLAARMSEPALADGAYAGQLYRPALADLLLQAALVTLVPRPGGARVPVPVAFERLELFTPLPDDEPFAIVVEAHETQSHPLFGECTLTAAAPDGLVHQRWTRVRLLWAAPEAIVRRVEQHAAPRSPSHARQGG
ncbi:type I polyketide synthase [Streptomyces sp. DH12]|uniref:type I polyketide synthase n=1 Tax=Streptomyces sp. DH12 TaxID=2857010 RepID=UPI001E28622D|nr:type I polyketide synthase [Streptomyces sp. DH12]